MLAWYQLPLMQTPMQHSLQLEGPNFLDYMSFFLLYIFLLQLDAPCFLLQLFWANFQDCFILENIFHLQNTTFLDTPLYNTLLATKDCSFIFVSSFSSFKENPNSTPAFPCEKIRIFFTTSFRSPIGNGKLVTKPRKRSSILSFIVKFSMDEYTLYHL